MKKHKWWHFLWGTKIEDEIVYNNNINILTSNYWESCKKCGEQVGEKQGVTTFSISFRIK